MCAPGPSRIHGQGLFATQTIRAGDVVFLWEGRDRIVSDVELRRILEGAAYWSCVAIGKDQNIVFSITYQAKSLQYATNPLDLPPSRATLTLEKPTHDQSLPLPS